MNIETQLTQINNAITAIENGAQEYRIGNRSLKRPDLVVLYAEREKLENRLCSQNNSGPCGITYVARFAGR